MKNFKKYSTIVAFSLVAILGIAKISFALSDNDLRYNQWNADCFCNDIRNVTFSTDGLTVYNKTNDLPEPLYFGTGLSYSSSTSMLNVSGLATSSVSGLSTVATTGNYSDLLGTPSVVAQIQSDWGQSSTTATDFIKNKPIVGLSYEGTSQRTGTFAIFKSATVSSGVAVFHLTADGTSGGSALFPNGIISSSINITVNDSGATYQTSYAFSNSNKTLTVTANKTAITLGLFTSQVQANGASINLSISGY